jgi:hypothetical protein
MKLKVPYTNVVHNKINSTNKEVPLASKPKELYFNKILAIKEATNYIKSGQRVPVDLINEVNVYEIQQQVKTQLKKLNNNDKNRTDVKIFDSSLPKEFQDFTPAVLKSYANVSSMAMKAKIDYYKMMTPTYTLSQFSKVEYKSPTQVVAKEIGKPQAYIYDTLGRDVINTKDIDIPENVEELFNPLNVNQKGNVVTFEDEVTGKDVNVILTQRNQSRINDKFGSTETAKAKDYIKGWYYESAYKVGFLEANKSQSGFISEREALELRNIYVVDKEGKVKDNVSPKEYFASPLQAAEFVRKFGYFDNLNDNINKSIELDSDFGGNIELKSLLGDEALSIVRAFNKSSHLDITDINKHIPAHTNKRFVAREDEVVKSEPKNFLASNNHQNVSKVVA